MKVNSPTYSWIGTNSTDWGTPSNWTGGIPSAGADVVYASTAKNDLVLDRDRTIGSLINNTTKRLIIPAAKGLVVNNAITTNSSGSLIYICASSTAANGSLIFHNAPENPVTATVEMYTKAFYDPNGPAGFKYKWQYFGIPVKSIIAGSALTGSYCREYTEFGTVSIPSWTKLTASSDLSSFKGYEITQASPKTVVFDGILENSTITKTLTYTAGTNFPGSHIIGNSYTSAIDISKLNFTNMEAAVYLFNTGSSAEWSANSGSFAPGSSPGQYVVAPKNLAGNGGIPSQIPSMQGFMVNVNAGGGTLTIPYTSAALKNTSSLRIKSESNASDEKVFTIIDVKGNQYADRMWIFTDSVCTHNYDNGWDGNKMLGSRETPQIFAMEKDGNFQVNSVDDIDNTIIGFQAGVEKNYTLTFSHQNMNTRYPNLYLVDLIENKTVDISQDGSNYAFETTDYAPIQKRFKITTSANISTNDENTKVSDSSDLKIYVENETIHLLNKSADKGHIKLYDMWGRTVEEFEFNANSETIFYSKLKSGVYLAKAYTSKESVVVSLIISSL